MKRLFFLVSVCLFGLQSCVQKTEIFTEPGEEPLIVYQVFLRSFYDSDGDGIGDLKGLISQLDYIESLGANALWLLPVHPAPSYHKYDVLDYYGIDPVYGTDDDFKALVSALHHRNMKIIMDMVFNHSSEDHPWFQEAIKNPENKFRDYYVWKHPDSIIKNHNNWHLRPEEERKNDHSDERYFGFFWKGMPDLNFDNPQVREAIKRISNFWLTEIGVDGFRLDAALHIYPFYPDRTYKKSVEWWEEYHEAVESTDGRSADKYGKVFLVGEVWEGDTITAHFLEKGLDATFNFELAERITATLKAERDSFDLIGELIKTRKLYKSKNPLFEDAIFLSNHDQNRIFSQIKVKEKAKLAASILLTLPGIPFVYYGEEIGMKGKKPDEQIREPMLWDAQGKDPGQTSWEPLEYNKDGRTVKEEATDPESILNHYKSSIAYRKANAAIHAGEISELPFKIKDGRLLGYQMTNGDQTIFIIHNLSKDSLDIDLPLPGIPDRKLISPYKTMIFEKQD